MIKSEKTKIDIMLATEVLLSKNELQSVTVNMISNQVGIHRSTFYRYFTSFDELLGSFLDYKFNVAQKNESEFLNEINNILNVIDSNLPLFRHCVTSINKFDTTLQQFLLRRLEETRIETKFNIDVNDKAEISLLFNVTVGMFSCWLLNPSKIQKKDIISFLNKYFRI